MAAIAAASFYSFQFHFVLFLHHRNSHNTNKRRRSEKKNKRQKQRAALSVFIDQVKWKFQSFSPLSKYCWDSLSFDCTVNRHTHTKHSWNSIAVMKINLSKGRLSMGRSSLLLRQNILNQWQYIKFNFPRIFFPFSFSFFFLYFRPSFCKSTWRVRACVSERVLISFHFVQCFGFEKLIEDNFGFELEKFRNIIASLWDESGKCVCVFVCEMGVQNERQLSNDSLTTGWNQLIDACEEQQSKNCIWMSRTCVTWCHRSNEFWIICFGIILIAKIIPI